MRSGKLRPIIDCLFIMTLFTGIGIWRWRSTGSAFYLINFGYIGLAITTGIVVTSRLPREKKIWGRRISQLLIGVYMLCFLGFLGRENMQIEGFFFYLLAGFFAGAVLHYFIAKLVGPFLFGRAWCAWACWTAMVLDFLPWSIPRNPRLKKWGALRAVHFLMALGLVLLFWFYFDVEYIGQQSSSEFCWLIIGNVFYYSVSIILAAGLKDNRAFCKYVCPVPVLQKIGARFSLFKIQVDKAICTECGLCEKRCPMNIKILDYMKRNRRILSTECILCETCICVCPEGAAKSTVRWDGLARLE